MVENNQVLKLSFPYVIGSLTYFFLYIYASGENKTKKTSKGQSGSASKIYG